MMSKEYANKNFERITWEMRQERIPNDYDQNVPPRREPGEELFEKLDEIELDTIKYY